MRRDDRWAEAFGDRGLCIAMREMREPDAFPVADAGPMKAIHEASGTQMTAAELLTRAERWRPWRANAAVHLWTWMKDTSPIYEVPHDKQTA